VTQRPVWVVVADPLTARVFFDCGIVDRLTERVDGRLTLAFSFPRAASDEWAARVPGGVRVLREDDLYPVAVAPRERVRRRVDRWLDERIGYYPLAIRLNLRHGFHRERMRPGHRNHLLDADRVGPLPVRPRVDRAMRRWHFSPRRYVASALRRRLEDERPAVVLSNLQMQSATPFIVLARRLDLTVVGYVASWDHTVGKGVISPHSDLYVVQNRVMEDDLRRYHGIAPERVRVTGWPQTDLFHRMRPRAEYDALLRRYGLDPGRPLVVVGGNTPSNAPYEGRFVERLVEWWDRTSRERLQLLFRPHPRDTRWHERFAAAVGHDGIVLQEASYSDIEELATLLQHADVVVCNAGTILLDALVGDRPAVCVLYDEGAPPGESWAAKNVVGEHYQELAASGAFHRAERFEEVVAGIERSLAHPHELAEARRRAVTDIVGVVDGRAAERVVAAILEAVPIASA
jgi:UDP-N-acetylglucosamine:LPS N-acetylglucosamine transferase